MWIYDVNYLSFMLVLRATYWKGNDNLLNSIIILFRYFSLSCVLSRGGGGGGVLEAICTEAGTALQETVTKQWLRLGSIYPYLTYLAQHPAFSSPLINLHKHFPSRVTKTRKTTFIKKAKMAWQTNTIEYVVLIVIQHNL